MAIPRTRPPFFNWRQAILESDLHATTKHVLLTLSCHMNDAGESCYPSIARLCRETSLSNRAVITHLQMARERGWIGVRERDLAGKKWATHGYFIRWPDEDGSERRSPPSDEMAVNDVHDQSGNGSERRSPPSGKNVVNDVHHVSGNGSEPDDKMAVNDVHTSTSVSTSVKENINIFHAPPGASRKELSIIAGRGKERRKLTGWRCVAFLRFWKAFGHPHGRADAAGAWMDIPGLTPELAEDIIAAARAEARRRPQLEQRGRTPIYAQGWLNGNRWEDEALQRMAKSTPPQADEKAERRRQIERYNADMLRLGHPEKQLPVPP